MKGPINRNKGAIVSPSNIPTQKSISHEFISGPWRWLIRISIRSQWMMDFCLHAHWNEGDTKINYEMMQLRIRFSNNWANQMNRAPSNRATLWAKLKIQQLRKSLEICLKLSVNEKRASSIGDVLVTPDRVSGKKGIKSTETTRFFICD